MKDNSTYPPLQFSVSGNIGTLMLCMPPANRMNRLFFSELEHIICHTLPKSGIKALIINSSGHHFSSGADLDEMMEDIRNDKSFILENEYPGFLTENTQTFLAFSKLKIPVIAALKGICIGSAFELALFCHVRICTENTLMALPESGFNLIPGCGGISKLTEIVGKAKAIELVLTGKNISATEAKELKLIYKIVQKNELIHEAEAIAMKLAAKNEFMDLIQ